MEQAHSNAWQHGWHDNKRSFGELIALCHSELSEALEELRFGMEPNRAYYQNDGKPCGIPSELADSLFACVWHRPKRNPMNITGKALVTEIRTAMPINSKRKGKAGELELSHKLKDYGYDCHRSQQYCGSAGDADVVGLDGIH